MNIEKAELKINIANDIGASVEDSFESAKKEMYRQEGALSSFGQAAKACEMLVEVVNKDLAEGKIESLEHANEIKLWLTRAANAQRNLARQAENLGMAASGKVAALEQTVAMIAKYRHAEELKIAASRLVNPEDPAQANIGRPGLSVAQRRKLEETKQPATEQPAEAEPAPATIPPPKPRARRPKKR